MKKTMKTMLALMAGVITFSACSNEDVTTNEVTNVTPETPEVEGIRTFTAFTESDATTRATIDGFDVKWQSGDAILVMGDNSDKYNLTDGAGTTSGTFTADDRGVTGSDIYAVYPCVESERYVTLKEAQSIADKHNAKGMFDSYRRGLVTYGSLVTAINDDDDMKIIDAYLNTTPLKYFVSSLEGTSIKNVILPSTQTVSASQTVDPKAVLMAAKADAVNNLSFKNVCSYIKVTPTIALKKIVVSANNSEELAGTFTVDMSAPNTPTAQSVSNGSSAVTLQAEDGNLAADRTYYIAVLPGTLDGGLSIKFYTGEASYRESSISTSFTFERSKVYNGGSQPASRTIGTAAATGIGNVGWVQLWAGGPKFAEYNVGVTDGKAESYGGLYAWGGSQDKVDDRNKGGDVLTGDTDTATKLWGSNWRMPTKAELDALLDNCDVEWTTLNGVNGCKFTGKGYYECNSVFLPAAGDCFGVAVFTQGGIGKYWSSTPQSSVQRAYRLKFIELSQELEYYDRSYGSSVRAVLTVQ